MSKTGFELPASTVTAIASPLASAEGMTEPVDLQDKDGKPAEIEPLRFTVGQAVRIFMPGGSLDGIETRIQAQVLNVLGQPVYQLDYLRQGQAVSLPAECLQAIQANKALPGDAVIRATAAQLLQVLGQACPFVGPGLWEVRRDEVPAKAWNALQLLVTET